MMTSKDLAEMLDGIEYPVDVPEDVEKAAKHHGLVIIFGASDDLMEFRGAIDDEMGCYDGGVAHIDSEGLSPDFDSVDKDDKDAMREWFKREGKGRIIEALWCKEPNYSWTYKTDIPHATFEVVEDGEPYCRGIVFSLVDCTLPAGAKK
jgi:hypothetical protein